MDEGRFSPVAQVLGEWTRGPGASEVSAVKPERMTEQLMSCRPQLPDGQLFFSPKEVADLLEMSVSWVYNQVTMGSYPEWTNRGARPDQDSPFGG